MYRAFTAGGRSEKLARMVVWYIPCILGILLFVSGLCSAASCQYADSTSADLQEQALDVFLDGMSSFETYIKEEIPYVNYVRDVRQADLYLLKTVRSTGGGDTEYTLTFFGRNMFEGVNDTLTCFCRRLETVEQCRAELVRIMKMGIVRYVSRTPQAEGISIDFQGVTEPTEMKDGWDYWVFYISANGYYSEDESYESIDYGTSLSADRVTPDLKVNLGFSYYYSETSFDYSDVDYTNIYESGRFDGLIAKSFNDHLSYGLFLSSSQSIYGNIDRSWEAAPAIEYSLFPYAETSRRDLRLAYKAGYRYNDYEEETIYYKMEEELYYGRFSLEFDMKTFWGTLRSDLTASHYFHDFDLNRLKLGASFSFRVLEGLSLRMSGSYSAIHDQITLVRGSLTEEDVLLRRKELATQYNYSYSLGFTYRFGSKYSNVINPRF